MQRHDALVAMLVIVKLLLRTDACEGKERVMASAMYQLSRTCIVTSYCTSRKIHDQDS